MTILACAGLLLGELAILLDLGSRLFGSYARTPIGSLSRILLLVILLLLLASPLPWLWIDSASHLPRYLLYGTGALGSLAFLHFVVPYRWGIAGLARVPAALRHTLAPGIELCDSTLELPSLPEVANGLTCLVLSDLHCNNEHDHKLLRSAIENLAGTPADFVFLLGDFGENKSLLPQVVAAVARVSGRLGTYCVLGNHDCEGGRAQTLLDLLSQHSVHVLSNETHYFPELQISLLGLAYPWQGPMPSKSSTGFVLCLTHSPDNIVYFQELNVTLGFAGHTHGGKLTVPGFGSLLVPSRLGRFLAEGWFKRGESLLYLTRGIGYFPGRFRNVGEIFRVTLKRTKVAQAG